jgi:hypothetical protein
MSINPLKAGSLINNSNGIRNVARNLLRERAGELAVSVGRTTLEVSKSDWDEAKRELKMAAEAIRNDWSKAASPKRSAIKGLMQGTRNQLSRSNPL